MRIVRVFDGLTYTLTALVVLFFFPKMLTPVPYAYSFLSLFPLFLLAVGTHFLPVDDNVAPTYRYNIFLLRLSSLVTAGLGPFLFWWLRAPENVYFLAISGLALGSLVWFLLELLDVLDGFSKDIQRTRLSAEIRVARLLLKYAVLIPLGAVFLVFFLAKLLPMYSADIFTLFNLWQFAPAVTRLILVIAPLMTLVILWKSRKHLLGKEVRDHLLNE